LHPRVGRPRAARSIAPVQRFCSPRCQLSGSSMARLDVRMSASGVKAKQGKADEESLTGDDYLKRVEGRRKMRSNHHETRFCSSVGGGHLCRRIYSRLRPRRPWACGRVCKPWRPRARSYDSPGITGPADARFRKPDTGPARGTFAAARHQRAVGAKPLWRGYVGVSALTR